WAMTMPAAAMPCCARIVASSGLCSSAHSTAPARDSGSGRMSASSIGAAAAHGQALNVVQTMTEQRGGHHPWKCRIARAALMVRPEKEIPPPAEGARCAGPPRQNPETADHGTYRHYRLSRCSCIDRSYPEDEPCCGPRITAGPTAV